MSDIDDRIDSDNESGESGAQRRQENANASTSGDPVSRFKEGKEELVFDVFVGDRVLLEPFVFDWYVECTEQPMFVAFGRGALCVSSHAFVVWLHLVVCQRRSWLHGMPAELIADERQRLRHNVSVPHALLLADTQDQCRAIAMLERHLRNAQQLAQQVCFLCLFVVVVIDIFVYFSCASLSCINVRVFARVRALVFVFGFD